MYPLDGKRLTIFLAPLLSVQLGLSQTTVNVKSRELPQVTAGNSDSIAELPPGVEPLPLTNTPLGGLKALPSKEATLVFIGSVTKRWASIAPTGAISTFQAVPIKTLKTDESQVQDPVTFTRYGGSVLFTSGRLQEYRHYGEHMPLDGNKYLFFLRGSTLKGFILITAYRITRQDLVYPLDDPSQHTVYQQYNGASLSTVLKTIDADDH